MKTGNPVFIACILTIQFLGTNLLAQPGSNTMQEQYRPQIHFSPAAHWINDPNGMVFYKGVYHLFFQYYPDATVWGPMHWGHATSTDMMHWQEKPIALYPDKLGYIFSGSAVVDEKNTSGLAKKGEVPLVAIFTYHDPKGEKEKRNDFQNQGIAYSLDAGNTWIKYAGNPVLKNPGITDFRDPKVMWYAPQNKWVMTLAVKDHIRFYSSPDLKNWKKESEFGQTVGAHGGVWECPDLFTLNDNGKTVWVLIVNLNPGGPNKGSATQYFLGNFDGNKFTPTGTQTKWLDYGPDEYAGITWSNTGNRKIFLGWMSNWLYANQVPTVQWRNAMTIPRELYIAHAGAETLIGSMPVKELSHIQSKTVAASHVTVAGSLDLSEKTGAIKLPAVLKLAVNATSNFSISLSNDKKEKIIIGFDKKNNRYFMDRSASGETHFQNEFAATHTAPRFSKSPKINLTIVLDDSSAELFADDGLTVMTQIFFPSTPYNKIHLTTNETVVFDKIEYTPLKSIWK